MDRDIIVIISNCDGAFATVNGKDIGRIEYGYDLVDILPPIFEHLEHSYSKPVIADLCLEMYDLEDDFWDRWDDDGIAFTEEELKILDDGRSIETFVEKVNQDLRGE